MGDQANIPRGTAGKILLGFSLLVALVAIVTIDDRLHRNELEEIGLPTGLGDDEIYVMEGTDFDPLVPILRWDGKDMFQRRRIPLNRADEEMLKVARDDGDRLYFYREGRHLFTGTEPAADPVQEEVYFVKAGENLYMEVGSPKPDAFDEPES